MKLNDITLKPKKKKESSLARRRRELRQHSFGGSVGGHQSNYRKRPVSEKFEELTPNQAFQEVIAQYKNLEVYKPEDYTDIYMGGGAIIASAQDLIAAIQQIMKVTSSQEKEVTQ